MHDLNAESPRPAIDSGRGNRDGAPQAPSGERGGEGVAASLLRLQRLAGNTSVVQLLDGERRSERTAEAASTLVIPGSTPKDPEVQEKGTHVDQAIEVQRQITPVPGIPVPFAAAGLTPAQRDPLLSYSRRLLGTIRGRHDALTETRRKYYRERWFVAPISEWAGGAELPDFELYNQVYAVINRGYTALRRAEARRANLNALDAELPDPDLAQALYLAQQAEAAYSSLAEMWYRFQEQVSGEGGGVDRAVWALELTRDISFTIAVGLATGGTASGYSLGAKALIAGGYAFTAEVVEESVTRGTEMAIGTRQDFQLQEVLLRAGKAGIGQVINTFVGGKIAEWLAGPLSEVVFGGLVSRGMAPAAANQAVEKLAGVFAQLPASIVQSIFDAVVTAVANSANDMDPEEMAEIDSPAKLGTLFLKIWRDNVAQELAENIAEDLAADAATSPGWLQSLISGSIR